MYLSELRVVTRVDVNVAFTSGIRASGSGSSEYVKKIVLKDASSYGPWRTKLTAILDAEDCLEIVNGTLESVEVVSWGSLARNHIQGKLRSTGRRSLLS